MSKTAHKKQQLIELAKSGAKRPVRQSKIGNALHSYAGKSNGSYDEAFDKEIRALRPDWFLNLRKQVNQQELLDLAKSGAGRPQYKSKLDNTLCYYTCLSSGSYDEAFDKEIRALRPDWFKKSRVAQKKEQLIELAKSGAERPYSGLGQALASYVCRCHTSYDEAFEKEIKGLRPDWFRKKT
jgi:hypothetical protein